MTRAKKEKYQDTEALREALLRLEEQKFRLDCGHHVTFGCFLGNDLTILNGKKLKLICSQCGY
jgi:ribosomal protein L33